LDILENSEDRYVFPEFLAPSKILITVDVSIL